MLFAIIWAVFIGTAFLIAIIVEQKKDEKQREEMRQFLRSCNIVEKPKQPEFVFLADDYFDNTVAEKENQEPYVIILWWGIDGLRLNDDGSFEWIKKNKEEVQYEYYTDYVQDILGNSHPIQRRRPVSVSYQPQQTINKEIYELEEKIRNYPKNTKSLPDEYWIMIHTLSELYKCKHIQESLTKCCFEEYGLPKV